VWVFLGVGFLGGCKQKKPPGFFGMYPGVWTLWMTFVSK